MSSEGPPKGPEQFPVPQWEPPPPAQPPAPVQYPPPAPPQQYPPAQQAYPPPAPQYAPAQYGPPPQQYPAAQYAPPPAKRRGAGRTLLVIGLIIVLLLVILGVGAAVANASLSSTYSPGKAVIDYLAAQKRGDAAFMIANANYLRGDGSYSQFFDENELKAMLAYPENTDISDAKVTSVTSLDSNTTAVNVSMLWNGHQLTRQFSAHKDPNRVHYNFYNSWRVDIPYGSIKITTPNQPGNLLVDGLAVPAGAIGDIQVIPGFHKVAMTSTDIWDAAAANADGIDTDARVAFPGAISASATAAAKATIKKAFNDCRNIKYSCLGKTYNAGAGYEYVDTVPGYGTVHYTWYKFTLTRDPTIGMKMTVEAAAGKVTVSGPCFYTMTVSGGRAYKLKGDWRGTLTMSGGSFGYDIFIDCIKSKA